MHTIDATNQSLGRLASQIAILLRGKDLPAFRPHILPTAKVKVLNVTKVKFTGSKLKTKTYYSYSGYPGGIYATKLADAFDKNPDRVLRKMVYDMLPKNRTRDKIIKNLEIQK